MKRTRAIPILSLLAGAACFQVGPKDEPLHIILDVNIKVQVERDVQELWDTVEETAESQNQGPVGEGVEEE